MSIPTPIPTKRINIPTITWYPHPFCWTSFSAKPNGKYSLDNFCVPGITGTPSNLKWDAMDGTNLAFM